MSIDALAPPALPDSDLQPDFHALFQVLPSPYMVLDRELRYVAVNDAYCAVTERRADELIGRPIFELFPNPGEGGRRLRASFEQVIETGKPHSIPLIPYPIPLPISRGGGFEMRYWSAAHTPLLDAQGRTRFIVQNTVDVTDLQRLKAMAYGGDAEALAPREATLLQRAQEVERANRNLLEESRSLRDLFAQAPGFMAVLSGPDLIFSLVNNTYQQLIGHRPVIGRPVLEALPEIAGQGFDRLLHEVMRSGEPYIGSALSVMLQREPGAPLEERFLDFIYQPMRDPTGEVWGVFVEGSDVTDRVLAERRQKLLLDELNHRVKNTLSTVQAIAAQTLRSGGDVAAVREAFESRLMALSATHDLLTATSWQGAALRDVLLVELKPYAAERYRLAGPEVALAPAEALAFGLLIHELATNAAKYGALKGDDGLVEVCWGRMDGGDRPLLILNWTESGGPRVTPPSRRGFGSRLIERSLKGALRGSAELDFAPEGLRCHVELPLSHG
ncbi:PAS domain-containing protein [Phenylobacterium soli]|uniref:histidine kinase n=1 Tax=Phenylobacterium soli TaxID=2170551 RepID=A0A328AB00_9CAUL|nr:PAS domain-containing protein [Phenylobacterium soli]RAK51882.1 histidine kinase [Phenylobacterium soli]